MRIALEDSDTPSPSAGDADILSPEFISDAASQKYLPEELGHLFEMWLDLVRLSVALGNVLVTNYKTKGAKQSRADIERCEAEIRASQSICPRGNINQSCILASHTYLFKLYFE